MQSDDTPNSADVLGILGSPRRGGNSEILLDRALDGAKAAGKSTSKLVLNDLRIRPCQNCGLCERTGECSQKDDMLIVRAAMESASRIILAAPIYFASVSAQTKIMIDRCQVYWARKFVLKWKAPRTDRQGAFISVGGFKKGEAFFECASRVVSVWYFVQDIAFSEKLSFPGIDKKGEALNHPDALDKCFELGKRF
jgi:multimeric flavodoxin WrbA